MLPTTCVSLEVDSPLKCQEGSTVPGVSKYSLFSLASVVSNTLGPHGLYPVRLLCHGISQARILEWDNPLLQGIFPTWDQTHVSCVSYIAGRFVTTDPLGNTKNWAQLSNWTTTKKHSPVDTLTLASKTQTS